MGQRRAAADSYQFELVVDDDGASVDLADLAGQAEPHDDEPVPPTLLDRVRAWPRRRVVAAAVAVAVVIGVGGAAHAVGERHRVAALRAAAGGVVDLGGPPEQLWSVDLESGVPLMVLGGLVVVVNHEATDDPGDVPRPTLLAIDPADGSEAWRRELPREGSICGPSLQHWQDPFVLGTSESAVCVVDVDGELAVQVIDAEGGVTAQRALAPGDGAWFPAADGGLVHAESVGEPGPMPTVVTGDDAMGYKADGPFLAPDVRVTMVDAATGDIRWEKTVESTPTAAEELYSCLSWGETGTEEPTIDFSSIYAQADEGMVAVTACGIDAVFTPSGVRLDVSRPNLEGIANDGMYGPLGVVRTAEGLYLRPHDVDQYGRSSSSPYAPWDLLDRGGAVVARLPGRPLEPWASDGSRAQTVLVQTRAGIEAVGISDGEVRWEAAMSQPLGVLVRAAGRAVVATSDQRLVALDLDSGEERWSTRLGPDLEVFGDLSSVARSAFTDGRVAVVATPGMGMSAASVWTAYDLGTGDVVWTWEPETSADTYGLTVDGRPFYWDFSALTALG